MLTLWAEGSTKVRSIAELGRKFAIFTVKPHSFSPRLLHSSVSLLQSMSAVFFRDFDALWMPLNPPSTILADWFPCGASSLDSLAEIGEICTAGDPGNAESSIDGHSRADEFFFMESCGF